MNWTTKHEIQNSVVSDDAAEQACFEFAREQRILVELSSGAALTAVYNHPTFPHQATVILVIVCGGVNISHFKGINFNQ